jgi:hypothetical protein
MSSSLQDAGDFCGLAQTVRANKMQAELPELQIVAQQALE